jgi:hypothetical protein
MFLLSKKTKTPRYSLIHMFWFEYLLYNIFYRSNKYRIVIVEVVLYIEHYMLYYMHRLEYHNYSYNIHLPNMFLDN